MSDFQKDNVALMCDIGELVGLFDFHAGLDSFLQKVVSMVAWHMRAAVCSIYLFEPETQELVLRANQGLSPDMVGHLRLKMGEGITGTALKRMEPMVVASAAESPHFKFIPGSGEEKFLSFLAVPISRKMYPVGVIVVQDPQWNYFTANDVQALKVISSQLTGVIENAHLLMRLHDDETRFEVEEAAVKNELAKGTHCLSGQWASGGMAIGLSTRIGSYITRIRVEEDFPLDLTEADFDRAAEVTERQLVDLQSRLEDKIQDAASMIFGAHVLMLKDEAFAGEIRQQIRSGKHPAVAILDEIKHYTNMFSKSSNPMMREKVLDVEDLGHRLLYNLSTRRDRGSGPDYSGQIVIAEDLLPSDILKLSAEGASGLILLGTGQHSHVAILAKALDIPMVTSADHRLLKLPEHTLIMLDPREGHIVVNPGDEAIHTMQELIATMAKVEHFSPSVKDKTFTKDGVEITLRANLNLLSELDVALNVKANGIGLYRTEFPFIIRNSFPTEEEQYQGYKRVLERMNGRPVVFRTLDIGGDKALSYFPTQQENNPFLGLRALRFSLRNPKIFKQQIRALLRAAYGNPQAQIMFPLVASLDEFLDAKEWVHISQQELAKEGIPHRLPEIGVMIEIPSAAAMAQELAGAADFLSIGSNDLIQYLLAVDRTNNEVASFFSPHHPAVLRTLKRIVSAGAQAEKPVSICGNVGADLHMLPFLLGIGLRIFSLDPASIPAVQQEIEKIDMNEAAWQAQKMLSFSLISEVEDYLTETTR